jgi:hypothetical protein
VATNERSRASGTEPTSRFLLEFEQSWFSSFPSVCLVIPCEIAARCVQRRTPEAVPNFQRQEMLVGAFVLLWPTFKKL